MKKQISIVFFLLSYMVMAQETKNRPFYRGNISSVEYVSPISSRSPDLVPFKNVKKEAKDKRSMGNIIISGKDPQTKDDFFKRNRHPQEQSVKMANADLVFDTYSSNSQPTDPSLAVGPNHVMIVFNTGFMIYDKQGNQLLGETAPNPAIFPSGGCCDLTVSYDNSADRWVLTFLGNGAQIAVSDGPNPLTSGWYVYNINQINDYQKLSIWSDGYYITDNTNSSNRVWALDRTAMLAGNSNAGILGFNLPNIRKSGFYSPQVLNVTDSNLPATGGATVVYMQDNAWYGVSTDHVKVWTIDVNWNNTASSTVSNPQEINITPFIGVFDGGSFSNLPQPNGGRSIDVLQATIMNQAQFRKFSTHNSAVFNFVVDTDASAGKLAGIRWMEFRQSGDNQPWSLYQEGTYNAPDSRHAWNASLAMDADGNIGMGYTSLSSSSSASTTRVSSYFTGRLAGDPLGVMTATEGLIANGNQNIPGRRYGDYSKIDVDPTNNSTFWYITEYMNNGRKGVVGTFKMKPVGPPDTEAPTNPSNLTVSNITGDGATLNWTASTDNVGIARYLISIDGTQVGISSTTSFNVTGLSPLTQYTASVSAQDLAGNTSGSVSSTFTTTEMQISYCASKSSNTNDEHISNVKLNTINNTSDAQFYSDFTNISTELNEGQRYTVTVSPTWTSWSGTTYREGYAVWIDYNNNGVFTDSGELVWSKAPSKDATNSGTFIVPSGTSQVAVRMRVSMKYNGIPTSCETFTHGEVEDYTINLKAGDGGGDSNPPTGYCNSNGYNTSDEYISRFQLDGIDNVTEAEIGGYGDYTNLSTSISGTHSLTITPSWTGNIYKEGYAVWIDYNRDGDFLDEGELVWSKAASKDTINTGTFTVPASAQPGLTRLRVSLKFNAVPTSCESFTYGEVEDYLVNIGKSVSPGEDLKTFTKNSLRNIKLYPSPVTNNLTIDVSNGEFEQMTIYSITGRIVYRSKGKVNNRSTIDVSNFATGNYFVKFISNGKAVTKRFIKK